MREKRKQTLTHRERVEHFLTEGEVDRPPVSFWRHFYHRERNAADLAEAMLYFQNKFDWDFMKVNPRASYHVQPWGAEVKFSDEEFMKTKIVGFPVKNPEDWKRIEPKNPTSGALGEQLQALNLIGKGLKRNLHFLQTVFNPLSIAGDLIESDAEMVRHIRTAPRLVHQALEAIAQTFERYVEEVLGAGASGIFFATTQWASANLITKEEYLEFGQPYDLRILNRVREAEFNILHVCESKNFLELFSDYPAHAVNWDAMDETNLPLDKGYELLQKPVLGGVSHLKELLDTDPAKSAGQANHARHLMEGKRWGLAPGCSIAPETPELNLARLRNLVDEWRN